MTDVNMEETATTLARIEAGKAIYDELPDNDELKETADILDHIEGGKSAYDELPSNDVLDETAEIQKICAKGGKRIVSATASPPTSAYAAIITLQT
jgi:hypothetical protein